MRDLIGYEMWAGVHDVRSELRLRYLNHYLQAFGQLNVNRQQGRTSPHKPCMLLAVLGLAEAANLSENRIEFAPPLLERYARIFEAVRTERDHLNPYFPFFHLQRDRFWHLRALAGTEVVLAGMRTARSVADIIENVQHAFLDDALHELMLDEPARMALREQLIVVWFGSRSDPLRQVLNDEQRISQYETRLRGDAERTTLLVAQEPPAPTRDAAFRRVVTQIYDYRCAASGWRIILPDSRSMIEAAHLIPFSSVARR